MPWSRFANSIPGPSSPCAASATTRLQKSSRVWAWGVIHLVADSHGRTKMGHIKDALRKIHLRLLEAKLRDAVTIIISGGIAAAEHVPKAIICGADGVALDLALLVALECWRGEDLSHSPFSLGNDDRFDPAWGAQRIINLIGAWRDQLLEILGRDGHARGAPPARRGRGAPSSTKTSNGSSKNI
jgi:hypothetical protein